MVKRLIITADDLGYSEHINAGIIECLAAGAVTQSSLLVNALCVDDAMRRLAKSESSACLGLHLNLSEGTPLTGPTDIPTLVDDRGHFLGKAGILDAADNDRLDHSQVLMEVESQVREFTRLTGHPPRYVDGHQHVHVYPVIRDALCRVLQQHSISRTRLPLQHGLERCPWVDGERMAFYSRVGQHARTARDLFTSNAIRFACTFLGLSTMGSDMTVSRLQEAMLDAFAGCGQDTGEVELMVHPGYRSLPDGPGGCVRTSGHDGHSGPEDTTHVDPFSCSPDREWEMRVLRSAEMTDFYRKHDIRLVPSTDV